MPTTSIYALPYPASTDPADVPTDMRELAERLEIVLPPTYGTTLPASPYNGQQAILVDSLTNPSYQWYLRYNTGSSSPYKWELVGGPPLYALGVGSGETSSTTWIDMPAGPLMTLPRAGEYLIDWSVKAQNWGVSAPAYDLLAALAIGGTRIASTETNITTPSSTASMSGFIINTQRHTVATAGASAKLQVMVGAAVLSAYRLGTIIAQPVRLA